MLLMLAVVECYWQAPLVMMLMMLAGWVVLVSSFAADAAGARRLGSTCNLDSYQCC